ncbi:hypothetical protein M409DRAFT_50931 [Zasmidium cellare ATCC 36951]|uniref:CENP-V/GFA domain-containing protein n=1 Tax=Zasmidium cellare ATCC 36951 TaxID=1080233 RepID=A0A6A6CZA4_ZASCE|nr:uncharacterized protein M409DRAFT_50931 [Zasmidium cellare ATCC 36951]KAF2171498.1 hypothetical protein M409DRAFT_50931 [Zasmidium cellare ATCC 36951]
MSTDQRTTYTANCHCNQIRYTVTLPIALAPAGPGKINKCNCSICTKLGYLLVYPKREDVVFEAGCDAFLKDYYFGKKQKPHRFCGGCGSSVLIDFKDAASERERPFLAMNTRLFKDIDLDEAEYTTFDGRNRLEPAYEF